LLPDRIRYAAKVAFFTEEANAAAAPLTTFRKDLFWQIRKIGYLCSNLKTRMPSFN
jgi:hypothetical protein